MIVGTTLNQVHRYFEMSSQKSDVLNLWGMTTLPPLTRGETAVTTSPLMWYRGKEQSALSSGLRSWAMAV